MSLPVLYSILAMLLLLVMVFVIAALVIPHAGRALLQRKARRNREPTEYVDAWSQYRLSGDELNAYRDDTGDAEDASDDPSAPD